jgi:hypothetical protein
LQLDPRPMLLDLVLQSNPLKFRSCKFNVIINIINITLGLGIATKLKTLGYNFAKNLILLDLSFLWNAKNNWPAILPPKTKDILVYLGSDRYLASNTSDQDNDISLLRVSMAQELIGNHHSSTKKLQAITKTDSINFY